MEFTEIEVPSTSIQRVRPAKPRWHVKTDHGPFPNPKSRDKRLHLVDFGNVRCSCFAETRTPEISLDRLDSAFELVLQSHFTGNNSAYRPANKHLSASHSLHERITS